MEKKDEVTRELEAIKNLLILNLIKIGATSEEIGRAVKVDSSVIRRMFPMKKTKNKGD